MEYYDNKIVILLRVTSLSLLIFKRINLHLCKKGVVMLLNPHMFVFARINISLISHCSWTPLLIMFYNTEKSALFLFFLNYVLI